MVLKGQPQPRSKRQGELGLRGGNETHREQESPDVTRNSSRVTEKDHDKGTSLDFWKEPWAGR